MKKERRERTDPKVDLQSGLQMEVPIEVLDMISRLYRDINDDYYASAASLTAQYGQYVRQVGLAETPPEMKIAMLAKMDVMEQATIQVLTHDDLYFKRMESGSKGTQDEFFGSMVESRMRNIENSPNLRDGRYREQLLQALDVDGLRNGAYTDANIPQFRRQTGLLTLLQRAQGEHKLGDDFWLQFTSQEELLFTLHRVLARDQSPAAHELLFQALAYQEKLRAIGKGNPDYMSYVLVDDHVEGQTAMDRFLADPAHHYEQVFQRSHAELLNFLSEHNAQYPQKIADVPGTQPHFVVLQSSELKRGKVTTSYAEIDTAYRDGTIVFDATTHRPLSGDETIAPYVYALAMEFEQFRKIYLQALHGST